MPLQKRNKSQDLTTEQQEILKTLNQLDAADIDTIKSNTQLTREEVRNGIHSLWKDRQVVTDTNYKYIPASR